MARHETRGLVLEVSPFRDSSEVVALFAPEAGPIALVSLGARRAGRAGHAKAGAAPFVSARVGFSRRSEEAMGTLVEFVAEVPRDALREDLDAYAAGQVALELLRATPRHMPGTAPLLLLAERYLDDLDGGARSFAGASTAERLARRDAARADTVARLGRFVLDYLEESGHLPHWDECVVTHRPFAPGEASYFSTSLGGRVGDEGLRVLRDRRRLAAEGCRPVAPRTVALLDRWLRADPAAPPLSFEPTLADLERPLNLLVVFARHHLAAPLEAYQYLRHRFFARGAGPARPAQQPPAPRLPPSHDPTVPPHEHPEGDAEHPDPASPG